MTRGQHCICLRKTPKLRESSNRQTGEATLTDADIVERLLGVETGYLEWCLLSEPYQTISSHPSLLRLEPPTEWDTLMRPPCWTSCARSQAMLGGWNGRRPIPEKKASRSCALRRSKPMTIHGSCNPERGCQRLACCGYNDTRKDARTGNNGLQRQLERLNRRLPRNICILMADNAKK